MNSFSKFFLFIRKKKKERERERKYKNKNKAKRQTLEESTDDYIYTKKKTHKKYEVKTAFF